MDLTDGDKAKGMPTPDIWPEYEKLIGGMEKLERYEFYERAKKAYCIIKTGEEQQYANLLLVKGVVLVDYVQNDVQTAQPKKKNNGSITRGADYYRKP